MRIGILTVSDLGAVGQRADTSGDAIVAWAGERGYEVVVRSVVPDETDRIAGKLARWADSGENRDRKSTRLNSSHLVISYAVFCLKKKMLATVIQSGRRAVSQLRASP